jgi:hypothetical protein
MTSFTNTTLNYPQLSNSPIRRVIAKRSPTANDKRNFTLGDEWLNEIANQWWKLVALNNITGANWVLVSAQGTGILSLTGNSGGAVMADGLMNINVIGASPIDIAGNPGTNTLTVSSDGTLATNYIEDVGTATPSSGNLNVVGGVGIATNGAGNSITIATNDLIAKVYDGDVGSAAPALGVLNIFGGTGVDTSAAGNTVTINASANVPTTFNEDVGSATPAANILNIVGGAGISTAGAGSTVTITALAPTNLTFTENTGTATPAADNINVVGTATNGIATTGAGDTVTVAMNSPYADGDFEFRSTSSGALRTLLVDNTSNTAASRAVVNVQVAGTSAGDPWFQSTVGASRSFAIGASNANSQHLRINTAAGAAVSPSTGTNVWDMSPAGIRTMPLQPAFFAYVTSTIPNVTGDGTGYTVIFDTVSYNIQSCYNNATGIFTAPVTGVYLFTTTVYWGGITASHTSGSVNISSTAYGPIAGFTGNPANFRNNTNNESGTASTTILMLAGATASVPTIVLNGTKVVSILGTAFNGLILTSFSGALLF